MVSSNLIFFFLCVCVGVFFSTFWLLCLFFVLWGQKVIFSPGDVERVWKRMEETHWKGNGGRAEPQVKEHRIWFTNTWTFFWSEKWRPTNLKPYCKLSISTQTASCRISRLTRRENKRCEVHWRHWFGLFKAKGPMTPFVIPLLLASAFSLLSTLKCFAGRSNTTGTFTFPLSRQKNTIQLKQRHSGSLAFPLMENEQQLRQQNFMKSRFRRVCVFCGSSPGKNPSYQLAAIQLGKQLVLPTSSRSPFLWNLFTAWFKWKKDGASFGSVLLIRPRASEHMA